MSRHLFGLEGRRVLVTGASSGLGAHFAQVLAACGAHVVCAARRQAPLTDLVARLRQQGHAATALVLDIASAASVTAAFDQLDQQGGIDGLVNNAGVTVGKPAVEQTEADWDHVVGINLKGTWLVSTEAARRWIAAGREGAVVNVASILGERVAGAVIPYAVSKAGVLQMTKGLALELARHRIRVNALAPGYVATDLNSAYLESAPGQRLMSRIPMRRFGQPGDLDGALLLLLSDAGRFMTGSVLAVDGGHLVSSL